MISLIIPEIPFSIFPPPVWYLVLTISIGETIAALIDTAETEHKVYCSVKGIVNPFEVVDGIGVTKGR